MGFSKGNEVFDPVAEHVIKRVANNLISEKVAEGIMDILIESLQGIDWDTEDASLDFYSDVDFIVAAFERNGITLDEYDIEDDEDEDEDEDEDDEDEDTSTSITATKE